MPAGQLWAALLLPALGLEVLTRGADAAVPLALVEGDARAARVLACNAVAAGQGVRAGMRVSAALGVLPALGCLTRQPALEAEALQDLSAWAGQFSSLVSLLGDAEAGLVLEIGGSLRLFGAAEALCARLRDELQALGYQARVAAAPTPTAACWLARAGDRRPVLRAADLHARLAPLALHWAGLPAAQLEALRQLGVRNLGDCLRLPRAETARRFGPRLWPLLDRALGRVADPRRACQAPPRLHRRVPLPAPVTAVEALLFALGRVLRELLGVLAARGEAVARLVVSLEHPGGASSGLELDLMTPSRDARHLLRLLGQRLERLTLPDGVEGVSLAVLQSEDLAPRSLDLFDPHHATEDAWLLTLERLQARLGPGCLHGLRLVDEHRPERAWRDVELAPGVTPAPDAGVGAGMGAGAQAGAGAPGFAVPRPLWLLPTPRALALRAGVLHYRGPLRVETTAERIEAGWWEGEDVRRDYHIASNASGERFWVFRQHVDGAWFLHGVFA